MAKVKTNKTEYLQRIFTVQGWIIEGVQSSLIVRQILSNQWCQSQRHAERMLQQARDLWTDIPEAEIEQKRKLKIAQLEQYKRSLKDIYKGTPAGIRALVAVDKEIIMLQGLRKPSKVEVSGADGLPLAMPEIKIYNEAPPLARSEDEIQ